MLQTETNTVGMERRVMKVAVHKLQLNGPHHRLSVDFEHGQWWVSCLDCGAQYSVVDAECHGTIDGFDLEQISNGDESCR